MLRLLAAASSAHFLELAASQRLAGIPPKQAFVCTIGGTCRNCNTFLSSIIAQDLIATNSAECQTPASWKAGWNWRLLARRARRSFVFSTSFDD
jgi:hypothetical protein